MVIQQQRVSYANAHALRSGIQIDSSLSTALALSPQLKTFERDLHCEQQQLHNLAHWAYHFSPSVCIPHEQPEKKVQQKQKEQQEHHLLLIEIQGSIKLFHKLKNILNLISTGLSDFGYNFTMGLAHTPKAAELMALGSLLLSRPPPIEQVPSRDQCLSALRQLSIQTLQVDGRHISKLRKMGLQNIGQILDLPSQALGKRFGREFLQYLQKTTGQRNDPRRFIKPRESFSSQLFFLEPIENSQMLLFPMQRLLDELCQFLLARQLQCNHFSWHLRQGHSQRQKNGKHSQLDIQLSQAQVNKTAFLNLTRIQLEKIHLRQAVHTVELKAINFVQANAQSQQLFDTLSDNTNREPLDSLLDKLQARLGEGTMYCIDCEQQHLPERANTTVASKFLLSLNNRPTASVTHKAAHSQDKTQAAETKVAEPKTPYAVRPAWLLRSPARVQQRDQNLYWRGKLELLQGPERIETGWWESAQQRDYYIAQHEDGGVYWLYKDIPSKTWYVQGVFS
ncbi:MAG: DNA polymerase Y family protein [Pseudomonadales bacterium]